VSRVSGARTKRKEVVFRHWHNRWLTDNDACLCRSSHSPVTCPYRQGYRRCHRRRDDVSPRGHGRDYSSPPSRKLCVDSDSSEDAADAGDLSRYTITVTNTKQFQLVAQYLAAALSFRQVSQVLMETKEVLGIGSIGSCSEGILSRYACFICAMNLQCIAGLLRQCWAFSVAPDMANHMATSYCDVRIRICHKSTVRDFHLLSILCMSGKQARLSSARSPRRWTLSSRTGARRLLERLGWREEDERVASGRNHADTSRSQARVHARLVRGPPT
jgi:hypothetical protein